MSFERGIVDEDDPKQTNRRAIACRRCGGDGIEGVVSREMAIDAGDSRLEGERVPCSSCGGRGVIEFEEGE